MKLAAMVLAAGKGVRMRSPLPKVLHPVCGRPMILHVLDAVSALAPERTAVVVGAGREQVRDALGAGPWSFAVQDPPRGTGDAVRAGLEALEGFRGTLLVVPGDTPLLTGELLLRLAESHRASGLEATVLTFRPPDPGAYGRVVRGRDGTVARIVEARDAKPRELEVREANSGIYCFEAGPLADAIRRIRPENAQGEYYLTDAVALLGRGRVGAFEAPDPAEASGVNTHGELAAAAAAWRRRALGAWMTAGVRVEDPSTTVVEWGAEAGEGTVIHPFTVIRAGVRVGRNCSVGPFAHLREGTVLADGARVGDFVETKEASLGEGSRALHLAYLGDATIGAGANVGAGTITANFDGKRKHRTVVGDGASLGSGTVLVAPVRVGPGAVTGAGAVVLKGRDVGPGEVVAGVPARPIPRRGAKRGRGSGARKRGRRE